MSHCISCHDAASRALQFGATNSIAATYAYGSLNAHKKNSGASGNFSDRVFTRAEIEEADRKLDYLHGEPDLTEWEDEEKLEAAEQMIMDVIGQMFGPIVNLNGGPVTAREYAYEQTKGFFAELLASDKDRFKISFL